MEQLINENPQKLRSMLRKGNNLFMPIIKCVSVNEDTHVVCLLVGRKCPLCSSDHLRNTCNVTFCNEVMLPFLQSQFPGIVNKVKPVFTFDEDLETVCSDKGWSSKRCSNLYQMIKFP